jgi:glycosyltransferase involved in cell wall biosynthesis
MKLSIIIPNYNSANTIIKTLQSVYLQSYKADEVLVIDDASTDGSIELIKKEYPNVKIHKKEKNGGAGSARNVGIEKANGDILFFVDSDVVLPLGVISELMKSANSADIIFPKIIYENGMSMYPNTKNDEQYLLISPAFLMARNSLNKLHGSYFDTHYTGYCEDTDFFLKCKLLGLTCKYISGVTVKHVVNKPKNREGRYYSEVVSTIYGAIKYFGQKDINHLDHAFKLSSIGKLFILGAFNFKIFDAQTKNFDKAGSALYKIKFMLTRGEKITDKGCLYLIWITFKGIVVAIRRADVALESRKILLEEIKISKQKSKIRILDISYGANKDRHEAANTHTFFLAKYLSRVTNIFLVTNGKKLERSIVDDLEHVAIPFKEYKAGSAIAGIIKVILYNNLLIIKNIHHLKGYDAVYERMSFLLFGGVFYSTTKKISLVYEINGVLDEELFLLFNITNKVLQKIITKLFKFQINRAACVIVQSQELKVVLVEKFKCKNVQVVKNGAENIHSSESLLVGKNMGFTMVYTGVLDDIHNLSEIFSSIHDMDESFTFYIVGDGPRKAGYKELYSDDKRFVFIGQLPYTVAQNYIFNADISIASYSLQYPLFKKYGFYLCPIKVLEYLSHGKPVLIYGVSNSQINEFVNQKGVFITRDIEEFQKKILLLMRNEDLRKEMGLNAKGIALQNTWEKASQKTYEIVSSLQGNE